VGEERSVSNMMDVQQLSICTLSVLLSFSRLVAVLEIPAEGDSTMFPCCPGKKVSSVASRLDGLGGSAAEPGETAALGPDINHHKRSSISFLGYGGGCPVWQSCRAACLLQAALQLIPYSCIGGQRPLSTRPGRAIATCSRESGRCCNGCLSDRGRPGKQSCCACAATVYQEYTPSLPANCQRGSPRWVSMVRWPRTLTFWWIK
jgi:hypothetical protein